jgi:hypothetical protein
MSWAEYKTLFIEKGQPLYREMPDIKWWQWPMIILLGIVIVWLLNVIPALVLFIVEVVKANLPTIFAEGLLFAITVLLGTLLYIFKRRRLNLYGMLEVLVGIAGALYVANTVILLPHDQVFSGKLPSLFLTWCASLYVIVRGIDNVAKFLQENSPKAQPKAQQPGQ